MVKSLEQKMAALSPARRKRVKARTVGLIEEEKALCDLRRAMAQTQESMAEKLGIGQEGISRLEKRSDLLISTLRGYVEAMGGKLRLVAEFPNRPPVMLSGLTAAEAGVLAGIRGKGGKPGHNKGRET
jgi:hypothetical protein